MSQRKGGDWERYTALVGMFVATGYLLNDSPQSLLLVGDPGIGKSQLLSRFAKHPTIMRVSDVTSDGLRHVVLPRMIKAGHTHLMLPEFHKLFQRRESTGEHTAGVLQSALSGELHTAVIGRDEVEIGKPGWRIGMLAAMTSHVYASWARNLGNSGFIDRILVVHVALTDEMKASIEYAIASEDSSMTVEVSFSKLTERVAVSIPKQIAKHVQSVAVALSKNEPNRNRMVSSVRALVRGTAAMRGVTVAARRDILQVEELLSSVTIGGKS